MALRAVGFDARARPPGAPAPIIRPSSPWNSVCTLRNSVSLTYFFAPQGAHSMLRSQDRILTTHTGSLPRPAGADLALRPPLARRGDRCRGTRPRRQGGGARGGGKADRRRHRRSQQRRAAARGVLPLRAPPHERLRRRLDAQGVRRRHALSGLHGMEGGARRGERVDQQPGRRPRGDRRGALPRSRAGRGRMRGFPRRTRRSAAAASPSRS